MVVLPGCAARGYAYAHALTKYFPGKRSITIHLVVMAVAVLFLPLSIASWWGRPPADATAALWLLGLFAVSIGVPFFALSANGPAAAGLVRAHRSSLRRQSLLPLRGEQYRQLPRADLLSVHRRAVHHARPAALGWAALFVALIALIGGAAC
jgi:hypothetical protein